MLRTSASPLILEESTTWSSSDARLRLAVGIASAGRPALLAEMLKRLSTQTRPADAVVVCAPSATDVEGVAEACPGVTLLTGVRGLPRQRNAIIDHLSTCDVVVFFDDDFIPCDHYLESVERIMLACPDIVMTTGKVLADGILGPGLTLETADLTVKTGWTAGDGRLDPVYNGYGCNMSVRLAPVREHRLEFDSNLPLYGWLEDVDFSRRLASHGRLVRSEATRGVHLGNKQGRQPGQRLGYSQVANPLYLMRKGTMSRDRALSQIARNLAKNILRSFYPEPWVDRRGRLSGNMLAAFHAAIGRIEPDYILKIGVSPRRT
jgi:GT2 family glycosyltransferase